MKFTLSLHDYMEQHLCNMEHDDMHCPICYDQCMTGNSKNDVLHIIECYKDEIITRVLMEYHDQHGELPALNDQFLDDMETRVYQEINKFYNDRLV